MAKKKYEKKKQEETEKKIKELREKAREEGKPLWKMAKEGKALPEKLVPKNYKEIRTKALLKHYPKINKLYKKDKVTVEEADKLIKLKKKGLGESSSTKEIQRKLEDGKIAPREALNRLEVEERGQEHSNDRYSKIYEKYEKGEIDAQKARNEMLIEDYKDLEAFSDIFKRYRQEKIPEEKLGKWIRFKLRSGGYPELDKKVKEGDISIDRAVNFIELREEGWLEESSKNQHKSWKDFIEKGETSTSKEELEEYTTEKDRQPKKEEQKEKKKESKWGALKKDERKGSQQKIVEEAREMAKGYPDKTIEEIIDKTIEAKKGEIDNIEKAEELLRKEESQWAIKQAQNVEKVNIAGENVKSEIKKEMRKNPDKSIEEVIGSITTSGVDYHNEIAQEALQKDEEFRKELEQIKEGEKKKKESDLGDLQMDKRKKSKKKVEVEDETFSNASEMLEEKAKGVIKKNPELTPKEAVEEAKSQISEFSGREASYPIYVKDVLDTRFREKLKEIKEKAKKKESKKNK